MMTSSKKCEKEEIERGILKFETTSFSLVYVLETWIVHLVTDN